MKLIKTLLTILFISLLSSPSWSVTLDDLVKREGIFYQKFTDVPFNGRVTGEEKRLLREKGSFKNGVKDGAWGIYYETGQVYRKGHFKNAKKEGLWVSYWGNGQLSYKGNYKNDKEEDAWVGYHENGQLWWKGNYKNGQQEGAWVAYLKDGTVNKKDTGTFKDGVKISD
tara:strand:- start:43 stop:549 length:507 start_codon:yes stop_codon:yes gene_type:complete